MSDGCKLILSPFTGRKKQKAWNETREKYMPEDDHTKKQEEWLEAFLEDKSAFVQNRVS